MDRVWSFLSPLLAFFHEDSPYRAWAILFVICSVVCIPPGTRRIGGISLCAVLAAAVIYFFIRGVFAEFTPAGY